MITLLRECLSTQTEIIFSLVNCFFFDSSSPSLQEATGAFRSGRDATSIGLMCRRRTVSICVVHCPLEALFFLSCGTFSSLSLSLCVSCLFAAAPTLDYCFHSHAKRCSLLHATSALHIQADRTPCTHVHTRRLHDKRRRTPLPTLDALLIGCTLSLSVDCPGAATEVESVDCFLLLIQKYDAMY